LQYDNVRVFEDGVVTELRSFVRHVERCYAVMLKMY